MFSVHYDLDSMNLFCLAFFISKCKWCNPNWFMMKRCTYVQFLDVVVLRLPQWHHLNGYQTIFAIRSLYFHSVASIVDLKHINTSTFRKHKGELNRLALTHLFQLNHEWNFAWFSSHLKIYSIVHYPAKHHSTIWNRVIHLSILHTSENQNAFEYIHLNLTTIFLTYLIQSDATGNGSTQ